MNKNEKVAFVNELCSEIQKELEANIRTDKIPQGWNGHELRMLLSEKFARSAAMSTLKMYPRSKRTREYRNTVLQNNL